MLSGKNNMSRPERKWCPGLQSSLWIHWPWRKTSPENASPAKPGGTKTKTTETRAVWSSQFGRASHVGVALQFGKTSKNNNTMETNTSHINIEYCHPNIVIIRNAIEPKGLVSSLAQPRTNQNRASCGHPPAAHLGALWWSVRWGMRDISFTGSMAWSAISRPQKSVLEQVRVTWCHLHRPVEAVLDHMMHASNDSCNLGTKSISQSRYAVIEKWVHLWGLNSPCVLPRASNFLQVLVVELAHNFLST